MKKLLMVVTLAILTVSLLVAAGAKESKGDDSLEKVLAKGVFVMGLDDSFPPMGFRIPIQIINPASFFMEDV